MSGQDLTIVEQHPYLGVIIDHQLAWKPHVDYVRGKSMKQIGFLFLQNIEKIDSLLPILDYASPVLDPYHHGDIKNLKWFNT